MKKLKHLKDEEKKELEKKIAHSAGRFGSTWSGYVQEFPKNDKYGLCSTCREFRLSITQHGKTYAFCDDWQRYLSGIDDIEECSSYVKRGQMSLSDMKEIAIILDIKDKKVGF